MLTDWITLIAKLAGILALIAGIFLIILGPAELVCFPWYMEGGRFHYEGFGFGSLVYVVIVGQVIVYPMTGAVLATMGYGHIKGYQWSVHLVRGLAAIWLIVGLPLMPVLVFLTLSFKALAGSASALLIPVVLLIYPIAPLLVRRLYRAEWLRNGFKRTSRMSFDERTVIKVGLLVLTGLVLVGALLFRGLMPVLGLWLSDIPGIIVTLILLAINSILLVMNLRRSHVARSGNLAWTIYWLITVLLASITFDWHTLLERTYFASVEKQAMLNIPILGWHIALVLLPSLMAVFILQLRTSEHTT